MKIKFQTIHLKRYKEIAALLWKTGAGADGLWLLFSIFFQDEKIKKKKKP